MKAMLIYQKRLLFNALAFVAFSPNDGAGSGGSGSDGAGDDGKQTDDGGKSKSDDTRTYDQFYDGLDDETKRLIDDNTSGLKKALDSERSQRKDFEKEIGDLKKTVEKGSEAEKKLTQIEERLANETLRADFYEGGQKNGVKNLKLAFTVAQQDELIDNRGRVNWEQLKKDYPELFGTQAKGGGDAGSGGKEPPASGGMNDFIRKQAGRG